MTSTYSTDFVIFGGGIAGLWLLNRLRNEGFDAILLESESLGHGQTIASQGIIHGGLKYALSGSLGGAADAIAQMPKRWGECIGGFGDVDLKNCTVLSNHYYMWSNAGFRSKLKTFLGSKSLRGRVEPVSKENYPDFFKQATKAGRLYQLPDFVVDTDSLLAKLAGNYSDYIFKIDASRTTFQRDEKQEIRLLEINDDRHTATIKTQYTVFCGGAGNSNLLEQAELTKVKSQTRPLHMVYLKHAGLPEIFVHCIGDSLSLTPMLTVTSHLDASGTPVWYLGGELAESGVGKPMAAQVETARKLLAELFPWVDTQNAHWGSFAIDRAEGLIESHFRPDDAIFQEQDRVIAAWPTKLTLSPSLADKIIEHLTRSSIAPGDGNNSKALNDVFNQPSFATAKWD